MDRAKGLQLHFQQDRTTTEQKQPVEQTPANTSTTIPEKVINKPKINLSNALDALRMEPTKRDEITKFLEEKG